MPPVPSGSHVRPRSLAAVLAFLLIAPLLQAMTVLNPGFSELVGGSEGIVRLRVLSTESRMDASGAKPLIHTYAECELLERIKGGQSGHITLRFLGGSVSGRTLRVPEMPALEKGGEYILFLSGKPQAVCPILAAGNGAYRVYKDGTGATCVRRTDGRSLDMVSGLCVAAGSGTAAELPLNAFEAAIRKELGSHEDRH
jgi:hypothetical protein